MTKYPVQCFDNNGETYGRYVNLVNNESCDNYKERYGIDGFACRESDDCFCKFAESNTFPFPSGTIDKTYERYEVEVGYQIEKTFQSNHFKDVDFETYKSTYRLHGSDRTRKVFNLIPQPVEKEPETVEEVASEYADNQHSTFKVNLYRAFIAGADWQKQQSR